MSNFQSNDPRAVRTRQEIQTAFIELLREKPYQSITVTDIAGKAGYARHTFYNHYETKDDLLANLIDSIFDEFFSKLDLDVGGFFTLEPVRNSPPEARCLITLSLIALVLFIILKRFWEK